MSSQLEIVDLSVRTANIQDVPEVVRVHLDAFPDFFLTRLGPVFLNLMYAAIVQDKFSVFVVAELDSKMIGFSAGAGQQKSQVKRMAFRNFLSLFSAVLPSLIRSPIKISYHLICKILSRDGHPEIPVNGILLRSIAVGKAALGTGAATKLIYEFENIARNKKYRSVFLTTDANDNDRVNRFYSKNGYSIESSFIQKPNRVMNFYKKCLLVKNINSPEGD